MQTGTNKQNNVNNLAMKADLQLKRIKQAKVPVQEAAQAGNDTDYNKYIKMLKELADELEDKFM